MNQIENEMAAKKKTTKKWSQRGRVIHRVFDKGRRSTALIGRLVDADWTEWRASTNQSSPRKQGPVTWFVSRGAFWRSDRYRLLVRNRLTPIGAAVPMARPSIYRIAGFDDSNRSTALNKTIWPSFSPMTWISNNKESNDQNCNQICLFLSVGRIVLGMTGFYWVSMGLIGYLPSLTGFDWVLQKFTGCYLV